jgi:mRNA interferase RelE/StbE
MPTRAAGEDDSLTEYRIFETNQFQRDLRAVDSRERSLLERKLKRYVYPQLRAEPRFGSNVKKLRDFKPETWRYRIGRFRVFYGIDQTKRIVNILTLQQRKDAYR